MVGSWLRDVLGAGAVAAALLAFGGWLLKQQISSWLNQDLERVKAAQLKDLEAKKAEYQRDLESYRVSLIAAAERSKAEAEIKKAAAIRIVEKRFLAIDALHAAVIGNAVEFLHQARLDPSKKSDAAYAVLRGRFAVLKQAFLAAEIFFSVEERQAILEYRESLLAVMGRTLPGDPLVPPEDFQNLSHVLLDRETAVDRLLRRQVEAMMGMQ